IKLSSEKVEFYMTQAKWCGKIINGDGIRHDPARVQGLLDMEQPRTAGHLMQFVCSVNWMRTHLPGLAQAMAPLQQLQQQKMSNTTRRSKAQADRLIIEPEEWTAEVEQSWQDTKQVLQDAVMLARPKQDWALLAFTDASDLHWGLMLTQVPRAELAGGIAVENMQHEPLAFQSGSFSKNQLNWSATDKEAYPIIMMFRRFEHLLWKQVHLYCDHKALAYIFHPHKAVVTVSKATSLRLHHWAVYLGQFDYVIEHLEGTRNTWADLLSRWRQSTQTAVMRQGMATFSPYSTWHTNMEAMPSVKAIKDLQQTTLASEKEEGAGQLQSGDTLSVDQLVADANGLMRYEDQVWIPADAKEMQMRLMVVTHTGANGHR
ncbi:unnamed protein product, partial [Chrysoparadoxa australica]